MKNAIIFCNRKRDVATLHRSLLRHGFSVQALHGDMDQSARTAALEQFRKGEVTLLVASDVAARGLDIPDVSHIYNFDVPIHADDYVHRIGRTGRAGRSGTAITIVAGSNDAKAVAAIEKLIGQPIPFMDKQSRPYASERRTTSTTQSARAQPRASAAAPTTGIARIVQRRSRASTNADRAARRSRAAAASRRIPTPRTCRLFCCARCRLRPSERRTGPTRHGGVRIFPTIRTIYRSFTAIS